MSAVTDIHSRKPVVGATVDATAQLATITPGELLAEHLSGTPVRAVASARRALVARGMRFATVGPDPAAITPVCTVSARDLPVVEVLAALAAQDPTGVLVIETPDDVFAFEVHRGRLTGARGLGPLDQLEPFVAEVHRRHPERFGHDDTIGRDHPAWMRVARAFVEERVLDQLALGRLPGTRMTLIRGDVEWIGTRLPPSLGPTLGHVLLEQARRFDEMPRIDSALGDLDRIVVPLSEPGLRPKQAERSGPSNDWDFFSDPDPAAIAEWEDAVEMFKLCDGESSLAELVDSAMLGRFRGLLALRMLASTRCIVIIDPVHRVPQNAATNVPQVVTLRAAAGNEAPLPAPVPMPMPSLVSTDLPAAAPTAETSSTGYSIIAKRPPALTRGQATPPPPAIARSRAGTPAVRRTARPSPEPEARRPTPPAPPVSLETCASPSAALPDVAPPESPASASITTREPVPDESTSRAARSRVAGRALDSALPSANVVMVVLAATGLVALAAALVAFV